MTDPSCCLRRLLGRSYETMTEESAKKSKVSSAAASMSSFFLLDQIRVALHLVAAPSELYFSQVVVPAVGAVSIS